MTTTKPVLFFNLSLMFALIAFAYFFPAQFTALIERPEFYVHAKFVHILTVTLVFSNAVIGSLWEWRSLVSKRPEIIRHTYRTVAWLDAVFTAPLIFIAVTSGIMLGTILGGVWSMDWLAVAFCLFLFSGGVWLLLDIPSQYKTNRLFAEVPEHANALPKPLVRLLWWRMGLNVFTLVPLLIVFFLMVHKPELPRAGAWLKSIPGTKVSKTD